MASVALPVSEADRVYDSILAAIGNTPLVRLGRIGRSLRVTGDFARFVQDLRRRQFDLAIDLQGLFRSGFLARA